VPDGERNRRTNHLIESGYDSKILVHGDQHGKETCQAKDHHGNILATRTFDYHQGDESYTWEVRDHH